MYEEISYVCIKLTDYCNLACKYCFEYKGIKEQSNLFSIDKTKQLVKFLLSQKLSKRLQVKITGGEVSLVLPHLKSVIKELKKIERYRDVNVLCSIITNGTDTDGVLDLMNKGYIDVISSKISWDGIHSASKSRLPKNNEYNDSFFNDCIKKYGKSKFGNEMLIAYALNRDTIDDLFKSFKYAVENGCTKLSYYYLFLPQCKGYYQDKEFLKKIKEQLYLVADYYNSHYFDYENWNNLYYVNYIDKNSTIFRDNACNNFGTMIYVDMNGKMYPCMMASNDSSCNDNKPVICIGDIWNGFSEGRLREFGKLYSGFKPCDNKCDNYHCEQCPVMMKYKDQYFKDYLYDMCQLSEIEKEVFNDMHIWNDEIKNKITKKMTYIRKSYPDFDYIPSYIFK